MNYVILLRLLLIMILDLVEGVSASTRVIDDRMRQTEETGQAESVALLPRAETGCLLEPSAGAKHWTVSNKEAILRAEDLSS